jgi:hypothetical protein
VGGIGSNSRGDDSRGGGGAYMRRSTETVETRLSYDSKNDSKHHLLSQSADMTLSKGYNHSYPNYHHPLPLEKGV